MERLFKERELVEYLGGAFSLSWVRHRRLTGGGVPFLKIGASILYRQKDADEWIASQRLYKSTSEFGTDGLLEMIKKDLGPPETVLEERRFFEKMKDLLGPPETVLEERRFSEKMKDLLGPPEEVLEERRFSEKMKDLLGPPEEGLEDEPETIRHDLSLAEVVKETK